MDRLAALDWLVPVLIAPFIGSFLGVLMLRLPAGEPVALDRSRCGHCGQTLGPRDLVPLVSWLVSRGRCRHCGARLTPLYPVAEIGALAVALWAASELSGWLLWASCGLGWALLTLAVIDLRHQLLPDVLTLPLIPAGLAVAYLVEPAKLPGHLIGAALGFAAFWLVRWAYLRLRGREGMGLGDAKLLAAGGAWLSWSGLPSVVLLSALAALLAVLLRGLRGPAPTAAEAVPYGTFLCAAIWLVWLYGPLELG